MNNTSPDNLLLFKGAPWIVVYTIETILILAGNSISIYIFWSIRKRLKRTSYLLINLAVADIFVGISMALFVWIGIGVTMETDIVTIVGKTGVIVDALGVVSSILSLVLVSLDRMFAILWPFRHRTVSTWHYHISVGIVWFLASSNAAVNASIDLYSTNRDDGLSYLMACTIIIAVVIITGAYLAIWISTRRNRFRNSTSRSMEQDKKLAKTLLIVTALSIITCLPSGISLALRDYLNNLHSFRVQITFAAQYANSFLNPVIYCFKMPEFKTLLKKLLCSCSRPQGLSLNENLSQTTNGVTLRSFKYIETL